MRSKYIVGTVPSSVFEGDQAVIFSSFLRHDQVAAALRMDVKGAGFVSIGSDIQVYGESVSLKIASRPEDVKAIKIALDLDR
jgi:hypothetical protein